MQVETRQEDDTLVVKLSGDWKLERPLPRFGELIDTRLLQNGVNAVGFDATELGDWDSSLLTFLFEGEDYCETHSLGFREETLPEDIANLIVLSRAVPEQETREREGRVPLVTKLGIRAQEAYTGFLSFSRFTGELVIAVARLLTMRGSMRWRDFWLVIQSNSSGALPIITLISFLAGLIVALLGAVVLRRFGAEYYVSYLVSYGILRELGALMASIIMAGRTGAAFAAELGTMKVTEEIDALKTLGISPVEYLVLPRVMGIFLMMPLLTIYADFIGILGGLGVTITMLDISAPRFFVGLLEPVTLADALLGLVKALVFGFTIGMSGCLRGLQTGNDAGAVGRSATSAVVTAITLIVLTNAVIDWAAALFEI